MIRNATRADKAAILDLSVDSGLFPADAVSELAGVYDAHMELPTQTHPEESQGAHAAWLVMEKGSRVIASAFGGPEPMADGAWNLHYIAVREASKGQGAGSALLETLEERLRGAGTRILIIETSSLEGFELTRRFYAKHGFAEEARIRDFYADGDDKVIFWKKLRAAAD